MDGFFKKVNQKINLGRLTAHGPWHHYFKGQIFEKMAKNQFWLHKLSASGVISM